MVSNHEPKRAFTEETHRRECQRGRGMSRADGAWEEVSYQGRCVMRQEKGGGSSQQNDAWRGGEGGGGRKIGTRALTAEGSSTFSSSPVIEQSSRREMLRGASLKSAQREAAPSPLRDWNASREAAREEAPSTESQEEAEQQRRVERGVCTRGAKARDGRMGRL